MADFIRMTCLSCGGKLQVSKDIEQFACGYCGNEYVVKREGGIVSLMPLVEELQQVRLGVDKTASELAIKRLEKEISEVSTNIPSLKEALKEKASEVQFRLGPNPYSALLSDYFWTVYPETLKHKLLLQIPYGSVPEAIDKLNQENIPHIMDYFSKDISGHNLYKPLGIKAYSSAYLDIRTRLQEIWSVYERIAALKRELQRHQRIVEN